MRRLSIVLVWLLAGAPLSAGCTPAHFRPADGGTEDDAAADAGTDAPFAPIPPTAPLAPRERPRILGDWLADTDEATLASATPVTATPAAPDFGDCSPWRGGGAAPCEPWPTTGRATCAGTEAHFPGEAGCRPIGSTCPTAWATDLPTGNVVYVRAGGSGGTGTLADPFATLDDALTAAAALPGPVTIALAAGTYTGSVTLPAGTSLWGACPAGVVVTARNDADSVVVVGASSGVHNLHIRGGTTGVRAPAGATATIDRVLVEDASGDGVLVLGGVVTANDLVVRHGGGTDARGLVVEGGSLTVVRGIVDDLPGRTMGFHVGSGGTLTATDLAVTRIGNASGDGAGDAHIVFERVVIEDGFAGLFTNPSRVELRHCVVRRLDLYGVSVLGGTLHIEQSLVEAVSGEAIRAGGATLDVTDSVVRDVTRREPIAGAGTGIATWLSDVSLARVLIERTAEVGIAIWEGAVVTASSIDTSDNGLGVRAAQAGAGIQVTDDARLELHASRIRRTRGAGLLVGGCIGGVCSPPIDLSRAGVETVATVDDLTVEDVEVSADGTISGNGVLVTGGAEATLTRVAVRGSAGPAVYAGFVGPVSANGTLTLAGVAANRGAFCGNGSTIGGSGVVLSDAGAIIARDVGSRIELADVVSSGAVVATDGAAIVLTRAEIVRIAGTAGSTSNDAQLSLTDTSIESAGGGLVAEGGGTLTLVRTVVRGFDDAGVHARTGTDVRLTDVTLEGSGRGLVLTTATSAVLGAVRVTAGAGGIVVTDRATIVDAVDVTVECTAGTDTCDGLVVLAGASADVTRVAIEGARGLGVGASGDRAELVLTELRVGATALGPGTSGPCAAAIGAYDTATVTVDDVVVDGSSGAGAELGDARATLHLRTGAIARAAVALELASPVAASTVLEDVSFVECTAGTSSDVGSLPTLTAP